MDTDRRLKLPRGMFFVFKYGMAGTRAIKVLSSNPSTVYWRDILHFNLVLKSQCLNEKDRK